MPKAQLRRLLDRLLLIPALILVIGPVQTAAAAVAGDFYVSGAGDDLTGDGSESNPWRTITHAVTAAGGGAPTIHVGDGVYGPDEGESYPIQLDSIDDQGITILGTGEGNSELRPRAGRNCFRVDGPVNGPIEISGLGVYPETSYSLILGDDFDGVLLDGGNGVRQLTLSGNELFGAGLLEMSAYATSSSVEDDLSVLIRGNYVDGFSDVGTAIQIRGSWYDYSLDLLDVDLEISGNTLLNTSRPARISLWASSVEGEASFDVLIDNNTFENCGRLYHEVSLSADGYDLDVDYSLFYRGNTLNDCNGALNEQLFAEYTLSLVRELEISGNTISGMDEGCFDVSSSIDTGIQYDADVVIRDNSIAGSADTAMFLGFYLDYSASVIDRDVQITNNVIDGFYTGVYLQNSQSESSRLGDFDYLIDGNTVRGASYGLLISSYIEYSGTTAIDYQITRNYLEEVERGMLVEVNAYAEDYDCDFSLLARGNCLSGPQGGLPLLGGDTHMVGLDMEAVSSMDVELNFGDSMALGFNTFRVATPWPSADSLYVDMSATQFPSADVSLVGNWWDLPELFSPEDVVYHGVDDSSFVIADLSGALSDELEFTASRAGNNIKLTAGAGSGFVAYAGDLSIEVTVDGVAVDGVVVAEDYLSLKFPKAGLSGDVEICVTNPGGQSGCETYAVPEDSGGGGCGVMPVGGGTPTAQDFFAQYFLLLLPALFLLRRRMSGVRPQPVGYVG